VDEGALRGLQRKDSGGRLLPAGVVRVDGPFASHQAVSLVVRRRKQPHIPHTADLADSIDASEPSAPSSPHRANARVSGVSEEVSPLSGPQPATPTIQPALSLSSSIASLDPLSRSVPPSPAIHALTERLAASTMELGQQSVRVIHELAMARGDKVLSADVGEDWEEVEIGKGLAHYNSSEIDRIKGLKR
jgi:glutamate 5-kinase